MDVSICHDPPWELRKIFKNPPTPQKNFPHAALPIWPIWPNFEVDGLDWQCCLDGSSKKGSQDFKFQQAHAPSQLIPCKMSNINVVQSCWNLKFKNKQIAKNWGVKCDWFACRCGWDFFLQLCAKMRMCKISHVHTHAKCVPGESRSLFAIMNKIALFDKFLIFASLCFDRFDEFFPLLFFVMLIVEIHFFENHLLLISNFLYQYGWVNCDKCKK